MSKLTTILVPVLVDLERRIENKVKAATTASSVTAFVVTLFGGLAVFHGGPVPSVITAAIGAAVTGILTCGAGWLAHHTPRTPPAAPVFSPAPPTSNPAAPVVPPTA